jgi:hypothetical protein
MSRDRPSRRWAALKNTGSGGVRTPGREPESRQHVTLPESPGLNSTGLFRFRYWNSNMPKIRIIEYRGTAWRMSDLARAYGLRPQTLAGRLDRGVPLEQALAAPLLSRAEAGRRGSATRPRRDESTVS